MVGRNGSAPQRSVTRRRRAGKTFRIGGSRVRAGQTRDVSLKVSETYSGSAVTLPVRVVRGEAPGPAVFVTGALHGDELNGTGIIRELILSEPPALRAGTLVLIPVVNMLGFERHSRYMPDRRDLNRAFPGGRHGSLTARLARTLYEEVVLRCDYGIDLHTAATRRTNFPNVRADLSNPEAARIARAFGCEVVINNKGPKGSFRRTACASGCPTILLEAGEAWKIERAAAEVGVRGVRNVLIELGMMEGVIAEPPFQFEADRTVWVRATEGGLLRFHVGPGDVVEEGQPLATSTGLLGEDRRVIESTAEGMVIGMTTLPAVKPGDPVCHVAVLRGGLAGLREALEETPEREVRDAMRSGIVVAEIGPRRGRGGRVGPQINADKR